MANGIAFGRQVWLATGLLSRNSRFGRHPQPQSGPSRERRQHLLRAPTSPRHGLRYYFPRRRPMAIASSRRLEPEPPLPVRLIRMDESRRAGYRQALDFYGGRQWPGNARRGERRLTFNYAKAF